MLNREISYYYASQRNYGDSEIYRVQSAAEMPSRYHIENISSMQRLSKILLNTIIMSQVRLPKMDFPQLNPSSNVPKPLLRAFKKYLGSDGNGGPMRVMSVKISSQKPNTSRNGTLRIASTPYRNTWTVCQSYALLAWKVVLLRAP